MNPKILFCNIHCVLAAPSENLPKDFDRPIFKHVSRANNGEISHVTIEFGGLRAKFFCCATFDGTGDRGISLSGFAMPRMKLVPYQKALIFLSILEYLVDELDIAAPFEFFRQHINAELNGGTTGVLSQYDMLSERSRKHVEKMDAGKKAVSGLPASFK